ncbi:MAG: hypothetical protein JWM31_2195, partial [Solirubrobacterales bacterium]|nr:hypothetical protein [Solirubrobacterales bacterium]
GSGGDDRPPAALATRLVPANALVYVHLSTDTGRSGTRAARALAERFPGFKALRATLVKRLSAPGCQVPATALKNSREIALALVDTGRGNAGSLVYVDTGDESKLPERTCGAIQTGKFGRFLVIGQPQSIVIARQLAAGKGRTLAADPRYRRELRRLPAARVADLWVTRDGVQRLLAPQGGILGAAGTLLDQPGLIATAGAVTAADQGARVVLRSLKSGKGSDLPAFTPRLPDSVPGSAFAYLGLKGISGAAGRLLGLAGAQTAGLAPLLARAGADLGPLLRLFAGEVAITITPDTPVPVLSIITRATDPNAAAATLAAARPKVARLLAASPGDVPEWKKIGDSYRLRPAAGVELDYKVVRDLVVVSTRQAGLAAVRDSKSPLSGTAGWRRSVGKTSNPVTSLVFLDFNQLLRLGEQTGLNDSRAYLAAKDDLQRLKSVGARSSSDGDESTVELLLSFP